LNFKIKSLKKEEKNKVKLDIEISSGYMEKALGRAYKEVSKKAKIPGFRPGKVPYNVIDKNMGKEYVLRESASMAISENYPGIIEESKINPVDYPKVDIKKIEEGKPLGFTIVVEVEPEIKLPKYKGLQAVAMPVKVSSEEVDKQIVMIRNNYATLEPLEEDRPVEEDDYVTIDFEGKIDGEDFEGNSAKDYSLEVGSKTLFEGFEKAILGMKKEDTKKETLVLPSQIASKELAGKTADFEITLKDIKKKVLPEINEAFLKDVGDYKDEKEFKDFIENRIKENKDQNRRNKIFADVMKNIIDNTKFDIPMAMISNRAEQLSKDIENRLKQQNINKETYLKTIGITVEKFDEEIKDRAENEIKEYLVFKALEKAEGKNIDPEEKDLDEEVKKAIDSVENEEEKKRTKEYLESEAGKKDVLNALRRRKIVSILVDSAKVKEEEPKKDDKKVVTPSEETKKEEVKDDKQGEKKLWVPGEGSDKK